MDFKYIEQLLERYWQCQTTPEEERILKAFFSQPNVPKHLARYRSLFEYESKQAEVKLSADFDQRLLALVEETANNEPQPQPLRVVKAERISLSRRLRPLFRAAAAVAIVTLIGTATQHSFGPSNDTPAATSGWDYNQSAYKDSYQDPQKAYEASMETLEMFKEGAQTAVNDTAAKANSFSEKASNFSDKGAAFSDKGSAFSEKGSAFSSKEKAVKNEAQGSRTKR